MFRRKKIKLSKTDKILRHLYETKRGRILLKLLTMPFISGIVGYIMDTRWSKPLIRPVVKAIGVDLNEYEAAPYKCYNDFFTRQIKAENRHIDYTPEHLISPCDGKASAYKITETSVFPIKGSYYTLSRIFNNEELAMEYVGGTCLVIRLSVDNYHRYCYIDDAWKGDNEFIQGVLHTVSPIVFDYFEVFQENCREYCVMNTANFGQVVQMEVGALLVGQISNYHRECRVERGAEKGRFEYGGSTIVLFFKEGTVELNEKIWTNTAIDIETPVKMGEMIGTAIVTKT